MRTPFSEEINDVASPKSSVLKKGYITFYKFKQRPDFLEQRTNNPHEKRFVEFDREPPVSTYHKPVHTRRFKDQLPREHAYFKCNMTP